MRKTKTEYKIRLLGLYAISTHNLIFSVILQWWWWIEPENVEGLYIGLLEAKFTPLSTWVLLPLAMTSTLRHVKTFDFSFSLRFVVFDKSIVLSKFQILFSANIFITKTKLVAYVWGEKNYIDITAKAYLVQLYHSIIVKIFWSLYQGSCSRGQQKNNIRWFDQCCHQIYIGTLLYLFRTQVVLGAST